MSGNEQEPLHKIKENEEFELVEGRKTDEKPSSNNSSMRSGEYSVRPLIRDAPRRSSSFFFRKLNSSNDLDFRGTDNFQRNVFHYAVSKPDTLRKILKQLETAGKTDVQEALTQEDNEGETPIHRAARTASIKSLEILYEYDNSLMKLKTATGKKSVLHMAVTSRSVVVVEFVLSKVPELANCMDSTSQTPMHYAASQKQTSILQLLISKGCDTTEMDVNDQLPMHIAASKGHRNSVEILLREDPDVIDAVDNSDQSPLVLASKHGFFDVVSFLLGKNADYSLKDKVGFTAFDWAVKRTFPDVVEVFLERDDWKEVVNASRDDPEGCLTAMITNMPEMAKILLDKCVTTEGTKDHPDSYQVTYDFFCLESQDDKGSCPRFQALDLMVESICGICLGHPLVVKYVDIKWKRRGFSYTLAIILLTLLCHICIMVYTTDVIGVVNYHHDHANDVTPPPELKHLSRSVFKKLAENVRHENKTLVRNSKPPDAAEMMALRVIILITVFGAILKDILQMKMQGFHYFTAPYHYYRIAFYISVMSYIFPINDEITERQLGYGAVTVLLSWSHLIQFLKVVPVLGIYIILVEKVFWTVVKIFIVVVIYLLSFSTTFYVLLAENESFKNIYISFVSTFVAMVDSVDYENMFVKVGWYSTIYELKLVIFILFMLTMSIVVNNALIGLAVGDTNEVMKSARFDKFLQQAEFVIQLERTMNSIPCLKTREDRSLIEFPLRRKNVIYKISDLLYFGRAMDSIDGARDEIKRKRETEISLEDQIEKAFEHKLENFRSSLQQELKGMQDQINENLDGKLEKLLEKLEKQAN